MEVSRLTLAELLNVSPASSNFRELVASSRFYGLTNGGINADEFSLTPLGNKATGGDEVAQVTAYKQAVMNVAPYKTFFAAFSNKKIPSATAFKEFLTRSAGVAAGVHAVHPRRRSEGGTGPADEGWGAIRRTLGDTVDERR